MTPRHLTPGNGIVDRLRYVAGRSTPSSTDPRPPCPSSPSPDRSPTFSRRDTVTVDCHGPPPFRSQHHHPTTRPFV